MAVDTFFAYIGVYTDVEDAKADYDAVKALHTEAGLIDAYDAAIVEHTESGKVKIVKKHETPTRAGGVLGGGVGLATGLVIALFPAAAIGTGLLVGATAGGALLGSVAGHAAAGMSRKDLKEAGEQLDEGTGGAGGRRCLGHAGQDRARHEEGGARSRRRSSRPTPRRSKKHAKESCIRPAQSLPITAPSTVPA